MHSETSINPSKGHMTQLPSSCTNFPLTCHVPLKDLGPSLYRNGLNAHLKAWQKTKDQWKFMLWFFGQLRGTWSTVPINADISHSAQKAGKRGKCFHNFHLKTKLHQLFMLQKQGGKLKASYFFVLQYGTSLKIHFLSTEVSRTVLF